MTLRPVVVTALVLAMFAGCAAPKTDEPTPPSSFSRAKVFEDIQALMKDVPCQAPVELTKTSANLRLLSNITAMDDSETEYGSRELDIRGDLALTTLSRYNGIGVLNISDPRHPVLLSTFKGVGELDVKFSPDNLTAIAGSGEGLGLVDISDPAEPQRAGKWLFSEVATPPSGMPLQNAHMISTARIAGQDWIFLAPNSNTGIWILKLEGPPAKRTVTYVTQTLPVHGGPLGPHDMTVQYDADLATWIMYSSDGYHGWTAWDIRDPAHPALIGGLVKPETGYTHTIQAAKIGNRRIVATIQEVGVNAMEVYDATDLRAPVLVGEWQVGPASTSSQHNFNIVAGRLYMAHYGRGVFVFDLNKLGTTPAPLEPVAHFGDGAATGPGTSAPFSFYDVVLKDGIVWAASYGNTERGVFALGDGCLKAGDPVLTSSG